MTKKLILTKAIPTKVAKTKVAKMNDEIRVITRLRRLSSVGPAVLMSVYLGGAATAEEERGAAPEPARSTPAAGNHVPRPGASGSPDRDATPASPARSHDAVPDDPRVDELCQAAVALALAEPDRARSFLVRARLAGWLPELHFRLFRRFARTEGLTLDDTSTNTPVDVSGVDDVRYEWRATWDLSRMVFNPDELQAHAEALRMADVRRDIQSLVVRLYFERRRLQIGPIRTEGSGVAAADVEEQRQLRVLEIEAQLEALTGRDFFHPHPKHGGSREAVP